MDDQDQDDRGASGTTGGAAAGAGASAAAAGIRYFCHQCNVEIPQVADDFSCPTCGGGFIEELPPGAAVSSSASDPSWLGGARAGAGSGGSSSIGSVEGFRQFLTSMGLGPQLSGSSSGTGGNHGSSGQAGAGGNGGSGGSGGPGRSITVTMTSGNGNGVEVNLNTNAESPVDLILNSFLNDLIVGLGGGRVQVGPGGGAGGGAVPFLGNLGDYVWGRDGLDAIVTQLMNQMEGGAPPLAPEKVDTLPTIHITQSQVDAKLQCSICWDDFSVGDEVKQLDCEHVFHTPCILPWLKLHGTCPICRRDFTEGQGQSTDSSGAAGAGAPTPGTNPSNPSSQPSAGATGASGGSDSSASGTSGADSSEGSLPPLRNSSTASNLGYHPLGFLNSIMSGAAGPEWQMIFNPSSTGSSSSSNSNNPNDRGDRSGGAGGASGGSGSGSGGNINMDMEFD